MGYRKKKKNIGIKRSGNAFERELQFKQDGQGRTQRTHVSKSLKEMRGSEPYRYQWKPLMQTLRRKHSWGLRKEQREHCVWQ